MKETKLEKAARELLSLPKGSVKEVGDELCITEPALSLSRVTMPSKTEQPKPDWHYGPPPLD